MEVENRLPAMNPLVDNQSEAVIFKPLLFDHFTRDVIHVVEQLFIVLSKAGDAIHMLFGEYEIVFWRLGEFIFYNEYGVGFKYFIGRQCPRDNFAKNTIFHSLLYPPIYFISYCHFTCFGHQNLIAAGDVETY